MLQPGDRCTGSCSLIPRDLCFLFLGGLLRSFLGSLFGGLLRLFGSLLFAPLLTLLALLLLGGLLCLFILLRLLFQLGQHLRRRFTTGLTVSEGGVRISA